MIHYHGGVLHHKALEYWHYAGRNFCVSYAYPEKVELCHEVGQLVMLDNGAFARWTQGKPTDFEGFYEWAEPWLRYQTTWAIIPDVMDGTDEDNDQLIADWPFRPEDGSPVFHLPESMERLERLVTDWPLVCLGISSKDYLPINGPKWKRRMEEIMEVACDAEGYPRTRLHMLRGLAFSAGPYPLYSADSATIASFWKGSAKAGIADKNPSREYARFDGRQPPTRWVRPNQDALLGFEEAMGMEGDPNEAELLAAPHPDEGKVPDRITQMDKAVQPLDAGLLESTRDPLGDGNGQPEPEPLPPEPIDEAADWV